MPGFTKLVPEIIQSSIWNETSDVRCVWITMLAMKDQDGYVRGNINTLTRMANVGVDAVIEAVKKFTSPDPSSHTPNDDGRRIEPTHGGWMVLNHSLYRARDMKAEHAEYMKKWRELKKRDSLVIHPSVSSSEYAFASVFDTFWKAYPKKKDKGHARTAFAKALKKTTLDIMLAALEVQKKQEGWLEQKGKFIQYPATWLNGEQWDNEDNADTIKEKEPLY